MQTSNYYLLRVGIKFTSSTENLHQRINYKTVLQNTDQNKEY